MFDSNWKNLITYVILLHKVWILKSENVSITPPNNCNDRGNAAPAPNEPILPIKISKKSSFFA